MTARSPNARLRTSVAKDLDLTKEYVEYLRATWCRVRSTVYDGSIRDGHGNVQLRPRRTDEYPENNVERWEDLARYARGIAARATELAEEAENQARAMEAKS